MKPDQPLNADEAVQPETDDTPQYVVEWQKRPVRQRLREADQGDFATPEEMKATIGKYVPDA